LLESIGCKVVVSPPTNRAILDLGCHAAVDETCLSVKVHLGHVAWLADRCDAVLVPRYVAISRNERECVKMWGLYDIVRNALPHVDLISYSVDASGITHKRTRQTGELYRLARSLDASPVRAARAVALGSLAEARSRRGERRAQELVLASPEERPRILVVGHSYNLYDELVGKPIVDSLAELGCDVLLSEHVSTRAANRLALKVSPRLYWTNNLRLLGAVQLLRERVDGIVFLVTFPCGPDSLVTDLAVRLLDDVPSMTLVVDEQVAEGGVRTRLESFVDIVQMRRSQRDSDEPAMLLARDGAA
jgi:predicted nucleotide-binding protein (sugar kinase/HSP70/actin superfamily)